VATRTVWQGLTRPGFVLSSWPWWALAYLVTGVPVGAVALVVLVVLLISGTALAIVLVGLPLLALFGLAGLPVAALERRRLLLIDPEPAGSPHRLPDRPGPWAWLVVRYREPATWRELAFTTVLATLLWPFNLAVLVLAVAAPLALLSTPVLLLMSGDARRVQVMEVWSISSTAGAVAAAALGAAALLISPYLLAVTAGLQAALTRSLIAPREVELAAQVSALTGSRVRLMAAFAAERRRLERDLHDGAQERLVALGMTLGLARIGEPDEVDRLLVQAQQETRLVLTELRELIHGIHPQILADRGLPAAFEDIADRSAVPVRLQVELGGRFPETIEATTYFAVREALTNVVRHSGASQVAIRARHRDGVLAVEVEDDGAGGAQLRLGGGLAGLVDRLAVLDGSLLVSSPPGGPTLLRLEIPCPQPVACG
jgi:signal transduction histidine kinase